MLIEWLQYFTTPCPRPVRAIGYLRELIGIETRFKRCRRPWHSHLENSKRSILVAAERCPRRRKALVFGTGLWHDIPTAELCRMFDEVVFVDILHLPKMHRRAKVFPNLRLETADVTGLTDAVWRGARQGRIPPVTVPELFVDDGFDLVVSLNICSQLPVMPRQYMAAQGIDDVVALDAFSREVIAAHLAYLRKFAGVVCLIADIERQVSEDGVMTQSVDTMCGVSFPCVDDGWTWDIAPRPEQDPHADIRLCVNVCYDLP